MFLTNHALTGTLIGLEIEQPVIIAPTAFASHLIMDAIPHHDRYEWKKYAGFKLKSFLIVGTIDSIVATAIVITACLLFPERTVRIVTGWFFALLPDLFYVPEIFFKVRIDKPLRKFHEKIQWWSKPAGILIEIPWAAVMTVLILSRK